MFSTRTADSDASLRRRRIGSISHTGGVLVVRHTQRAHREIVALIADLDDIAAEGEEHRHGGEKPAVVTIKVYDTGTQPAEKVAETLQDFVDVASWKKHADGGEGEVRALNGALVVKQTADVHRSIQRFLAQFDPQSRIEARSGKAQEAPATQPTPAAAARTPQDPFGVLNQARRPATGNGKAPRADRQKSPLKKHKRTVANFTVPAKSTD